MQPTSFIHAAPTAPGRSAAAAIAAATVISTVFVALDRSGGGHTPAEILAGIAGLATLKAVVHGVAIASVCAYGFGFATLAGRLGLRRPHVLAGLVVYLFGCAAMIGATIFDGFVIPHVAIDALSSPDRVGFAYNLVRNLGLVVNDLAKLGWVLQAVGTLAWSLALVRLSGAARRVGTVGVLSSALVCVLIALSDTRMPMSALLAVLLAQMLWNLSAAALLARQRPLANVVP
ncbi:hypothetical protein [Cognatilysobacter lacus]|uniref:DUF4386 family protein n=1 Tax=Cognatilysobacter lacus TaxID=1643323 RepID=A0A5D8Z6F6_9GAMM|nr:hypothetical protein [Lysobacter lacus]TZF89623.1 hypothetical protein FW784_08540 [Lysobacter lacus]